MDILQIIQRGVGQLLDRSTLRNAKIITPSDTVDVEKEGYVAFLDAADDGKVIKVQFVGGGVASLTLAKNEIVPILVKRVFATGTTVGAAVYLCN